MRGAAFVLGPAWACTHPAFHRSWSLCPPPLALLPPLSSLFLQYTDGTCQMQSGFTFLQICQLVPFIATPAANPVWTCGLQVQGSFQCSDREWLARH